MEEKAGASVTLGVPTRRRNPSPKFYELEVFEAPQAARARAAREIAAGVRCGCGLMLPHDPAARVRSCTLPVGKEKGT